jgi:hypothetical protein
VVFLRRASKSSGNALLTREDENSEAINDTISELGNMKRNGLHTLHAAPESRRLHFCAVVAIERSVSVAGRERSLSCSFAWLKRQLLHDELSGEYSRWGAIAIVS